jgi:hypothetical protein
VKTGSLKCVKYLQNLTFYFILWLWECCYNICKCVIYFLMYVKKHLWILPLKVLFFLHLFFLWRISRKCGIIFNIIEMSLYFSTIKKQAEILWKITKILSLHEGKSSYPISDLKMSLPFIVSTCVKVSQFQRLMRISCDKSWFNQNHLWK